MHREAVDARVFRRLVDGAVPERQTELTTLLAALKPAFFIRDDTADLCLRAKGAEIEFSHKTMRLFWLLGFAAWRIFRAYCPTVFWGTVSRQPLSDLIKQDRGFEDAEASFKTLLLAARALEGAESSDALAWPAPIPEPQADKSAIADVQDQAAFDLVMIATAYAFLHELRHVWHYRQPSRPSDWTEEEIDCDVFARGFIMDKAGLYADQSGYPFDKVVNKRAMGITLGAWLIYEITPEQGRSGTNTHPPIADRLDALIKNMPARQDADFWVWACTLLMAALRHHNCSVDPMLNDPEALAMHLLDEVRQI
jgi:hypothetical protein